MPDSFRAIHQFKRTGLIEPASTAETVGENLVENGALHPVRRLEISVMNRDLETGNGF